MTDGYKYALRHSWFMQEPRRTIFMLNAFQSSNASQHKTNVSKTASSHALSLSPSWKISPVVNSALCCVGNTLPEDQVEPKHAKPYREDKKTACNQAAEEGIMCISSGAAGSSSPKIFSNWKSWLISSLTSMCILTDSESEAKRERASARSYYSNTWNLLNKVVLNDHIAFISWIIPPCPH